MPDDTTCRFCGSADDVEPSTFDSPVGAFRVPACERCAYGPPRLSAPEAAHLVLDYPADDAEAVDR